MGIAGRACICKNNASKQAIAARYGKAVFYLTIDQAGSTKAPLGVTPCSPASLVICRGGQNHVWQSAFLRKIAHQPESDKVGGLPF